MRAAPRTGGCDRCCIGASGDGLSGAAPPAGSSRSPFIAYFPQQKFCARSCQDKACKLSSNERADVELGRSSANARRNARWTQADLARIVGIHERYLGSIEEGRAVMSEALRDRLLGILAPYDLPGRHCAWCEEPIPPDKDPRATHCSRQCTIDHGNDRLKRRKYKHVKT